jgi:hypothetical protein
MFRLLPICSSKTSKEHHSTNHIQTRIRSHLLKSRMLLFTIYGHNAIACRVSSVNFPQTPRNATPSMPTHIHSTAKAQAFHNSIESLDSLRDDLTEGVQLDWGRVGRGRGSLTGAGDDGGVQLLLLGGFGGRRTVRNALAVGRTSSLRTTDNAHCIHCTGDMADGWSWSGRGGIFGSGRLAAQCSPMF